MWGYGHMMGYGHGGWESVGWMMVANGVFWLILLALAVTLIYRAARSVVHQPPAGRSSAVDILEERYARGEIQRDEYLQKKKDILDRGVP